MVIDSRGGAVFYPSPVCFIPVYERGQLADLHDRNPTQPGREWP